MIADGMPIGLAGCATVPAQQWEAQDETRHIYGPGGTRLLTVQQRQATLRAVSRTIDAIQAWRAANGAAEAVLAAGCWLLAGRRRQPR
ncbi:hypothetical protein [Micromonospora taraxaci]|uniref:hypothetical protein n=1 Tax=Micromonospora taraxaci TaxID=1316803 RepID=UPI0033B4035B